MKKASDEMPEVTGRAGSRRVKGWLMRRLLINWPFFLWSGLAIICLFLYVRSAQYGIITAAAQVIQHEVAPLQMARVKDINVRIGDRVFKGQVLAQMDTTLIDLELAEAEATMATAQNTIAGYQGQMLGMVRTVEDEIQKSQHNLQLETNQMQSDIARLEQMHTIQTERDKLYKSNLISEQLADTLRPEIADMEKQVAAYPPQMALDQQALADQRKHRDDLQKTLRIKPGDDITKAISDKAVSENQILQTVVDLRKREKETYTLRADEDGVVSDIHIFPGVVAKAGDSVLTVISRTDLIIGYLPEIRLGRLKQDAEGYAYRVGRPAVKVKVVSVVPEIGELPVQMAPISSPLGVTMRSQKVVFQLEQPSDIMPGEKVQIRMENDWWGKFKHAFSAL
jgi:multidrug resistance efflux pump